MAASATAGVAEKTGAKIQRLPERSPRRPSVDLCRPDGYGHIAKQYVRPTARVVKTLRNGDTRAASTAALSHALGRVYVFLLFYSEHQGKAQIGSSRQPCRRGALADRRLGICRFCRFFDALLRDLFEFRHFVALFVVAARELGDRFDGSPSGLRSPTRGLLSGRERNPGPQSGGQGETGASPHVFGRSQFLSRIRPDERFRAGDGPLRDFMEMFQQARLVLPLADGETFVLARDPETISIKEILDCVRNSGKKIKAQINRTKEENEIDEILLDVDQSVTDALEGKSLQIFIVKLSPAQSRG